MLAASDQQDAPRSFLFTSADPDPHRFKRRGRFAGVERDPRGQHAPAKHSQKCRRVGQGRLGAALAIGRRARLGPGTLRPDPHQTAGIDMGERPATRADGPHIDPRRLHRHSVHVALVQDLRPAIEDQSRVETGPAHVGGDKGLHTQQPCEFARSLSTSDGAGHDCLERAFFSFGKGHRTAAGTGDQAKSLEPHFAQAAPPIA